MNCISDLRKQDEDEALSDAHENPEPVDTRLLRYRGVLSFLANGVLNNHLEAEDAVRNCLLTASSTLSQFGSEGAFRSWLLRILLDEALMILHKK